MSAVSRIPYRPPRVTPPATWVHKKVSQQDRAVSVHYTERNTLITEIKLYALDTVLYMTTFILTYQSTTAWGCKQTIILFYFFSNSGIIILSWTTLPESTHTYLLFPGTHLHRGSFTYGLHPFDHLCLRLRGKSKFWTSKGHLEGEQRCNLHMTRGLHWYTYASF